MLSVSIVLFASAMMLLSVAPPVAAAPVVVDTFVGDVSEAVLDFSSDPFSGNLSVELPRGANVTDASVDFEGIAGTQMTHTQLDFANGVVGKSVWAYHEGDAGIYPPKVDPYNSGWLHINQKEVFLVSALDGNYWQTMTTVTGRPPPAPPTEWPIQLYHFNAGLANVDSFLISWSGHGWCQLNRTTPNHVEMWLYNHTVTRWERIDNFTSGNAMDQYLNYTGSGSSHYLSTNGSIDVAMVGSVSMSAGNMIANGELYTDYIEVRMTTGTTEVYPYDVTLEIGGKNVTTIPNYLTGKVTIGTSEGLDQALQDVIDAAIIKPGDLDIRFNISIPTIVNASLRVNGLHIEYEPVVNLAPTWTGPASVEVDEDASWTDVVDLDADFPDDHNQGMLSFQVLSVSDPLNLSVRIGTDGSGNRTLEVQGALDFFGDVDVVLRATDLFDLHVDSDPITVTVVNKADSPVLDQPGTLHVNESEPLTHTFTASDVDLPDDVLTYSDDSDLFEVDATRGVLEWTPASNQVGTHNFRVTVTDRFGLSDTVQMTIVVANVNQPPVITSKLTASGVQGEKVVYTIRAEDPDTPFGDTMVFSAFADAVELTVNSNSGYMTFTPGNDQVPSFEITLRVEDSTLARTEATLVVTVENRNDAPFLVDIGPQTFDQGDLVSIQLEADDPDLHLDLDPAEVLTFETSGPDEMAADAEGLISFVPGQALVGEHTVRYTVRDRAGASVSITVLWTIVDVNDAPVVTTDLSNGVEADEDSQFSLDLEADDPDHDPLTWSDDSDLFDIEPSTGRIVFTPTQEDVGTHTVTVTVGDGTATADVTFDLVVVNVNDAPVVVSVEPLTGSKLKEGKVSFSATATDEDGDTLTYTWKEDDKVLADGSGPDPVKLKPGKHTVTLEVGDGTTSVTEDIELTVKESGESPGFGATIMVVVVAVTTAIAVRARARSQR
jgi:hypothetical protein